MALYDFVQIGGSEVGQLHDTVTGLEAFADHSFVQQSGTWGESLKSDERTSWEARALVI